MIRLSAIAHGRPAPALIAAGLTLIALSLGSLVQCGDAASIRSIRLAGTAPALAASPANPDGNALAQAGNDGEETEVSPGDIEKYVAVYKAMQRDRAVTVDQAATRQGLTVQTFRNLESRVARDDAALQRARDELLAAAQATPAARPTSVTPAP